MNNQAEIQWITPILIFWLFRIRVGILRVWDSSVKPGIINKNPYIFACTVIHRSKKRLEILGVDSKVSIYIFKQIVGVISRCGYKTGYWERYKNGKKTRVVFNPSDKFIKRNNDNTLHSV